MAEVVPGPGQCTAPPAKLTETREPVLSSTDLGGCWAQEAALPRQPLLAIFPIPLPHLDPHLQPGVRAPSRRKQRSGCLHSLSTTPPRPRTLHTHQRPEGFGCNSHKAQAAQTTLISVARAGSQCSGLRPRPGHGHGQQLRPRQLLGPGHLGSIRDLPPTGRQGCGEPRKASTNEEKFLEGDNLMFLPL